MASAIIFDIDGTLIDSVDHHAHSWVEALTAFGHPVDFAAVRRQIGKGGDHLMEHFLTEPEIATRGKALQNAREEIFKTRYLPSVRPFPDVRALFLRLKEQGHRLALASSAKDEELATYRKIAGIDDLLEAQSSSDDAAHSKPDPDIFRAALQRLRGVAPEQALAVGDTPYDAEAAAKAGLRTIGVTCGGWSERELRGAGCLAVYRDPSDLLAHIDVFAA